jgi:hypothetical protein
LFLNVGNEVPQPHNLRDSRSLHPATTGQFRKSPNFFLPQQAFKPDVQSHEPGDPRNRVANDYWLCFRRAKIECVVDFLAAAPTCVSSVTT